MTITYFPGANTPQGFFSRFDSMLYDPRVRHRIYIKGGAGCGKSTLMRTLGKTAQEHGADTEQGLCSSDPGSLDALLIPQAGLVVCDATAPHICEPSLCGCDGSYLDLGRFYDTAALHSRREELKALQRDNKACYGRVTEGLKAAQALYRLRENLVLDDTLRQRVAAAARLNAAPLLNGAGPGGSVKRLFFTGVTPEGCLSHYEAFQNAATVYLLQDTYHLTGFYLRAIFDLAREAGQDIIAGYSPLFPDGEPEQLYLPQSGTAFIRQSSHFVCNLPGTVSLDLDALVCAPASTRRSASYARDLGAQILAESVAHLQKAKAIHDELELQLRPFVDFEGVSQVSSRCCQALEALLRP